MISLLHPTAITYDRDCNFGPRAIQLLNREEPVNSALDNRMCEVPHGVNRAADRTPDARWKPFKTSLLKLHKSLQKNRLLDNRDGRSSRR
jgi:hypothetical protein